MIGAVSLMFVCSCGEQSVSPQGSATGSTTVAKGAEVDTLPRKGKQVAALAPPKAVFGMIWFNTAENREYIFDGADWVPRDSSVDSFYAAKAKNAAKSVDLTQDEVCVDDDPACTPTGAHGKHAAFDCKVCHKVAGRLVFDKTGPAYGTSPAPSPSPAPAGTSPAPSPAPTFDATAKTCSNIACHAVKAGTFSYYFPGGDGEPVLNTVSYGGGAPKTTPSWYATGAIGCATCHDNPPSSGVWHSGFHGGQGPTGAYNQCQFCHPDATGSNGQGIAITNPTLHANGAINAQATFKSSCFGCH